jgi:hypothetical protein
MAFNLLNGSKFQLVHLNATGAPGATDTTSLSVVDMAGFDSLCYVGIVDVLTAAGDVGLEAWEAASSAGTYYQLDTDYAGCFAITTSTGTDQSILVLDIQRPLRRWHSVRVHKATQASSVSVVAIKYNQKEYPATNTTENFCVSASATVTSPTSSM